MNKNLVIVLVILLLLVVGGVWYFMSASPLVPGDDTTSLPVVQNNNTNTTPQQATLPTAVTSTTLFTSDNTAMVIGMVNPKGAFTSYWYEYGLTTGLGTKTASQTLGSGFASIQTPGYITNLTKNTTYYFRLVAQNQFGSASGNQYSFKTTVGSPAPVGSVPTTKTISAGSIGRTTAMINGEVTPNKASTIYWFEYGKTTQLGNTSVFSSVGDGSIKIPVSISLADLLPLTTYYFRLNAQNQFGTINGSILNFKTLGPASSAVPTIVSQNATSVSTSTATLQGKVTPNGAETDYWFEYSTDSLFGSVLLNTTDTITLPANANTTSVKADISGLDSKTNYYFRLVGQNSQGTVRGDRVTFKTK